MTSPSKLYCVDHFPSRASYFKRNISSLQIKSFYEIWRNDIAVLSSNQTLSELYGNTQARREDLVSYRFRIWSSFIF